ncbi:MAG: HAD family hydrolase [Solobacterium sp.]|nr:HAD family hydrolase [Solobacterium sp.]
MRAVLFDFDGTLLDSHAMVVMCYMHVFEMYRTKEEFTRELQLEVFGPPLYDEMAKLFPGHDPADMVEEYRSYQAKLPGTGIVHLIPHAQDVLEQLRNNGVRMGVVSSRLSASCRLWMKEFDLARNFECILGQEQFTKAKPDPEGILKACEVMGLSPQDTIYIGDNASDVIAAQRAGCVSVGFVSEKGKEQEILDAHPDHVLYDLRDLVPIVLE